MHGVIAMVGVEKRELQRTIHWLVGVMITRIMGGEILGKLGRSKIVNQVEEMKD